MSEVKISKGPRVALCRECHGAGIVLKGDHARICPQCEGSGRVTVSSEVTLDIRPYSPKLRRELLGQ